MRWRVLKMGRALFDALHTYGVAVVIAMLTKEPVTLQDEGISYELTCPAPMLPAGAVDLFDQLFPLPTEEHLLSLKEKDTTPVAVTVLDGLLAALLTVPRSPFEANVHDLCLAERFKPLSITNGLQKVSKKIQDWKDWVGQTAQDPTDWVAEMLDDYCWQSPVAPVLFAGQSKHDLHALMTLDPSFAYSFHQPINTGKMTQKSNVALHGTRYATLLAFVGAARFLRSQSVTVPYLVFSVPLVKRGMIEAWTSLPLLAPEATSPGLALTRQWLAFFRFPVVPTLQWQSLAYQTLQKQKRQQPLCYESGLFDLSWLQQVQEQVGTDVLSQWHHCLQHGCLDEQEPLLELLKQQRTLSWYSHLTQQAQAWLVSAPSPLRRYRSEEVRILTAMIDPSSSHPLGAVLHRKEEGTVRFGRALRQLGTQNPALLRDFIDLLEPIRTEEELFPILRALVAECDRIKLRWRYIQVPSDTDFPLLLDDIHRHGIRQIIGVLLVLSALQYAPSENWKKYELSTLIQVLLSLISLSATHNQPQHQQGEAEVEHLVADETLVLLSQEESHEAGS